MGELCMDIICVFGVSCCFKERNKEAINNANVYIGSFISPKGVEMK